MCTLKKIKDPKFRMLHCSSLHQQTLFFAHLRVSVYVCVFVCLPEVLICVLTHLARFHSSNCLYCLCFCFSPFANSARFMILFSCSLAKRSAAEIVCPIFRLLCRNYKAHFVLFHVCDILLIV